MNDRSPQLNPPGPALESDAVLLTDGHSAHSAEALNQKCDKDFLRTDMTPNISPGFADSWSEAIVSLKDISEGTRSEKKLAHTRQADAVSQLASGIAHDFNNVLTVISGNLRLITEVCGQDLSADTRDMVADALSAADDGARLTSRLLALSHKPAFTNANTNINMRISEFVEWVRPTLGGCIEVGTRLAADLEILHIDPIAFDSVLLNLALDARDAMPDGGCLTLSTRNGHIEPDLTDLFPVETRIPCIVVEIADTGCGMSALVLDRASEPFLTTKDAHAARGLGLSMVLDFARKCGGRLEINSSSGAGTTISLSLPNQPAEGVASKNRSVTLTAG